MTNLLDRAVANLKTLPPAEQDEVARLLLQWIGAEQAPVPPTAEEEASFAESLAQADRREFASDAEIKDADASRCHEAPEVKHAREYDQLGLGIYAAAAGACCTSAGRLFRNCGEWVRVTLVGSRDNEPRWS